MREARPILPFNILYALQYREGRLGRDELQTLAREGFTDEAIYFTSKALNADPGKQRDFLEGIVGITLDGLSKKNGYRDFILAHIDGLSDGVSVEAVKLAQLSRQGFALWERRYRELAGELRDEGSVPVLIANGALHGLTGFVREYENSGLPMFILNPGWIDYEIVGHQIVLGRPEGKRVRLLFQDFERPGSAVLVDGTRKSGANLSKVENLWGVAIPERVIDRAPRDGF